MILYKLGGSVTAKVGPSGAGGGAPTPWVRPHPRPAYSPPPCSGGLQARPGWFLRRYSGLKLKFGWAFAYVLLEYAFFIVHFGEFSYLCLQNMYIPKLVENVSYKP